ncbi:MAG: AraC family ligand binding domain-containing protein, partial [Spirochaetia bacterium]|nr:AraC family ligand binding domain-containing protein [Spirochaetia bacterium]
MPIPIKTETPPLLIAEKLAGIPFWIDRPHRHGCPPGWEMRNIATDDYDYWVVADGRGDFEINGEKYLVSTGSHFLIHPGDRVNARQDPKRRLVIYYCHFRPEPHPFWDAVEFPRKLELPEPGLLEVFSRTVDRLSAYGEALKSPLVLKNAFLFETFDILFRAGQCRLRRGPFEDPVYRRFETLLAGIRSSPEHAWSLRDLAAFSGVDPATVIRSF